MNEAKNGLICEVLYRLNVGSKIDIKLLEAAFDSLLLNPPSKEKDVQLGAILTGLMARGPQKQEIIALLKSVFKLDKFDPKKRKKNKVTLWKNSCWSNWKWKKRNKNNEYLHSSSFNCCKFRGLYC